MIKRCLAYIILSIFLADVTAQEVVTGLVNNPLVSEAWQKSGKRKGITTAAILELPFIDDFSSGGVWPDPAKWTDKYVFINNSFSVNQISMGIATFDALDQTGRLYESAGTSVFEADRLTSLPINLNYPATDNIFLSFFYEAGGLGDLPESTDLLTLHFYAPDESEWHPVWKAPAGPTDGFVPVIIKIDDSRYLKNGFSFRFTGYASLNAAISDPSMAGNSDQWNIDYVKLDRFRNDSDTIPPDIAFTLPVRSLLNTYESMPWKQFRKVYLSEMGPYITINYRNNDMIVRNVTRDFKITDMYENSIAHEFSAGATNTDPESNVNYNATLLYTFNSDYTDSALFRIESVLTTDAFDYKPNDTVVYYQRFGDYFAYDDGTAEGGYGINGLGSRNAMFAYRYRSFQPDTIRAISICFNDSYQNSNLRSFDLMIWDDNGGVPSDLIYTDEDIQVVQGDGINGFYTYMLEEPQELSGDYFIGWKQRSETFLNAGFDVNTPHGGKQLYWLNGDWNASQANGSVMIRPVFGPRKKTVGINDIRNRMGKLKLWPNPASVSLNIDASAIPGYEMSSVIISDLFGRKLIETRYTDIIDVSSLNAGVYFMNVIIEGRSISSGRFIISR